MKKHEGLLLTCILALDMLTKWLISNYLTEGNSITVIPNFFWITFAKNTGAAWSILEGKLVFFLVIAPVALVVMTVIFLKTDRNNRLIRITMILLIAGTLGNFIDRAAFHYVRDFLEFNLLGYPFPIFNVADMSLTFGVGLMIIDAIIDWRKSNGQF